MLGLSPDRLATYRGIASKMKRRFGRLRPAEAVDQFKELENGFKGEGNHVYAAFCAMAVGRCEEALGQPALEAASYVEAGRLLLDCELETTLLAADGFEEYLTDAVYCYSIAIQIHMTERRPSLAGALEHELGSVLVKLNKWEEAASHFTQAAHLQDTISPVSAVESLEMALKCFINQRDYEGALSVLSRLLGLCSHVVEKERAYLAADFAVLSHTAMLAIDLRSVGALLSLIIRDVDRARASLEDRTVALRQLGRSHTTSVGEMLDLLVDTCKGDNIRQIERLACELECCLPPLHASVLRLLVEERRQSHTLQFHV